MKTAAALATAALIATAPLAHATGDSSMTTQATPDHSHDFDFLVGKWRVHHHRLKARLAGSTEWEDFEGTCEMKMTMNGQGTFDDNFIDIPSGGYWATGIRGYDPKTQTWAIWWLDARNPHFIEPPVVGNFDFKDGVGIFEGPDMLRGKPITVRFTWSRITPTSAHWEQAFSPDGGKSWETNWVMDLTRVQ